MSLADWYRRHCHSPLIRPIAHFGKAINRYYENLNYRFETNGERRVLEILSRFPCETIFDVGANVGDWAQLARKCFPNAAIYAFEPAPATYLKLRALEPVSAIQSFNLGLGSDSGPHNFFHYTMGHALSSVYRYGLHQEPPKEITVQMVAGDDFMARQELSRIDLLKIDAEGHELEVLKGFQQHLSRGAIEVIQFEYGGINIISKALLHDFAGYLKPLGYTIGKIYPREVAFREYTLQMEDFIGPNYLAVRAGNTALVEALR